MIRLCNFTEYGYSSGISMKDFVQKEPYSGKDKIVSYLNKGGKPTMVSMEAGSDKFTGERINGMPSVELRSDGKFTWWSDLAYHVEKYNLRLPKEFEEYVLNRP